MHGDDRPLPKALTHISATLEQQLVREAVAGALAEAKAQLPSRGPGTFMMGRLERRLGLAVPAVVNAMTRILK